MFKRMKIVTAIMMILVVFTAMQAISGSLFLSSLITGQHNFTTSVISCHISSVSWPTVGKRW